MIADRAEISWYHTIELPDGSLTPGRYDLRPVARRLPIPARLDGMRCLDVGTSDGFWAFELERRGAAEVVATDVEDPARMDWRERLAPAVDDDELRRRYPATRNRGFPLVHRALSSQVKRIDLSVYDLSAQAIGEFDFVFMGSLLLHLRDPVRALAAVRSVLRGQFLSSDYVSPVLSLLRRRPAAELHGGEGLKWWIGNMAAQRCLVEAAGMRVVDSGGPYLLRHGTQGRDGDGGGRRALRELTPWRVLNGAILRFGVPHAYVLARPDSP